MGLIQKSRFSVFSNVLSIEAFSQAIDRTSDLLMYRRIYKSEGWSSSGFAASALLSTAAQERQSPEVRVSQKRPCQPSKSCVNSRPTASIDFNSLGFVQALSPRAP